MLKIVVINPKGGCGKTTLATNLASYYAGRGHRTVLMDYDPQGSSTRWVRNRSRELPPVECIEAYSRNEGVTRSWQLRTPLETQRLVVDTPAAVAAHDLPQLTRGADAILMPVLPSDIDIAAASRCIADLLLIAKIDRRSDRMAVVANRVRRNTRMYGSLMRFLDSLEIPFVATLRDTQNYVQAHREGRGIHELKPWRVR
ncbi:MAG: AAA family ATPase, partial [Gammaproteobacteria bacterium]